MICSEQWRGEEKVCCAGLCKGALANHVVSLFSETRNTPRRLPGLPSAAAVSLLRWERVWHSTCSQKYLRKIIVKAAILLQQLREENIV